MNIVITLAGHSRRFKAAGYTTPKFLIEIEGRPIISHVVNMFGADDRFHFVLNEHQAQEHPEAIDLLRSLAKQVEVHIIPSHEQGPVFSAMHIDSIGADDEVIISYCDFLVDWNYQHFLKEVRGYDGAVPAFKGFHPASFGDTYYAYMRVSPDNEMLQLREKNSFTEVRHEEPASAGIYYFKEWKIFETYADKIMQDGFENLKEGYVSLLFNPMVDDGLSVLVNYVNQFICLGTPEDLEQYLFWSTYFNDTRSRPSNQTKQPQINLIPMAGKGSRFKQYGYRISKPLIQIQRMPMVVKACHSFPDASTWVFMVRGEDLKKSPIDKTLKGSFENAKTVSVDYDTSGQLATCLMARDDIDEDGHLFIASADYETVFNGSKWQQVLDDDTIDVAIWTCRVSTNLTKDPKAFAYCTTNTGSHEVIRVVEKDTISDHPGRDPLVVGSFWFRRGRDFLEMADEVIAKDMTVNGEHYVGNGINLMIEQGKKIVIFDIEQWISYGDPFELDVFFYWEEFFRDEPYGNR